MQRSGYQARFAEYICEFDFQLVSYISRLVWVSKKNKTKRVPHIERCLADYTNRPLQMCVCVSVWF